MSCKSKYFYFVHLFAMAEVPSSSEKHDDRVEHVEAGESKDYVGVTDDHVSAPHPQQMVH